MSYGYITQTASSVFITLTANTDMYIAQPTQQGATLNNVQTFLIVITAINLALSAFLHGHDRKPHNFFNDLGFTIIALLIWWWVGFFDKIPPCI